LDQLHDVDKTQGMARTLDEHIKRYQSAYATFGLLGLTGDQFQLDHKTCFISRKTISVRDEARLRQNQRNGEAQKKEDDVAFHDSDLIRQLRAGKRRRLFITGEGGIGKTEFTRHLALELAKLVEINEPVGVPWWFALKKLNGVFTNARRFIEERLAPHDHHWLVPLADNGKVVFIFDGLDELGDYRDSFLDVLADMMDLFGESSFVLAGRPGSSGDLPKFPDEDRHRLLPLTMPEIRQYVLGVYGRDPEMVPLGQRLVSEIESKRSSLFPVIQQPLMLALACHVFSKPNRETRQHELPANPAELVEKALHRIFNRREIERKDNDRWLDALSILAAFTLTEPGESIGLSTPDEHAKQLLRENAPIQLATDRKAQRLLNELAPACGLLAFENGQYTFVNRVLAEFLAARWIVRLGYPNWPYREQGHDSVDSGKPYTRLPNELNSLARLRAIATAGFAMRY
jgi:hypothetical protein